MLVFKILGCICPLIQLWFFYIEKTIDTNQLIGATVGYYNANIIARIQGLKEQTESTNLNINKEVKELSDEDIKRIDEALNNEY